VATNGGAKTADFRNPRQPSQAWVLAPVRNWIRWSFGCSTFGRFTPAPRAGCPDGSGYGPTYGDFSARIGSAGIAARVLAGQRRRAASGGGAAVEGVRSVADPACLGPFECEPFLIGPAIAKAESHFPPVVVVCHFEPNLSCRVPAQRRGKDDCSRCAIFPPGKRSRPNPGTDTVDEKPQASRRCSLADSHVPAFSASLVEDPPCLRERRPFPPEKRGARQHR